MNVFQSSNKQVLPFIISKNHIASLTNNMCLGPIMGRSQWLGQLLIYLVYELWEGGLPPKGFFAPSLKTLLDLILAIGFLKEATKLYLTYNLADIIINLLSRYGFLNENIRASLTWLGRHLTHRKCCKVVIFTIKNINLKKKKTLSELCNTSNNYRQSQLQRHQQCSNYKSRI